MQIELFERDTAALMIEKGDFSDKKIMIGLSGGINSMAVLCWLAEIAEEKKPMELHLFYAHFEEHSPDTRDFVLAGVDFANRNFKTVIYKETWNSIIAHFEKMKMIPHPAAIPICTKELKVIPIVNYMAENRIEIDLVGYVRNERRREKRMFENAPNMIYYKAFPIIDKDNEWCFGIVKEKIGWYPKIYDIRNEAGKRVFTHNNCLPCKNMQKSDFELVRIHYPEYWQRAVDLSNRLKKHWGRDEEDFIKTYLSFGREDWEVNYEKQNCAICNFD